MPPERAQQRGRGRGAGRGRGGRGGRGRGYGHRREGDDGPSFSGQWDRAARTYRGKADRKRAQIIHKATVKKKYAQIQKGYDDDTPEFYAEANAEQQAEREQRRRAQNEDVDMDDSTPEVSHLERRRLITATESANKATGRRRQAPADESDEYEEDEQSNGTAPSGADSDGDAGDEDGGKGRKGWKRFNKPNPLRRAQLEMEAQQRELERIREEERLVKEQRLREIEEKKKQRTLTRKRMMKKTRHGQPAMAGRIANLLDQLQK
ncbi:hypothetical protein THASP1DRAFT_29923 [Thamnocephalis sphaerospora]|uniref:rRNA-processing protein FYV7 n=1 Tax=Thamnocephalis sphaerospora TaxID=78915 RepID=A0A4P9XQF1_9FUNG|nr:hypothetical protein THASP1DRAFT_29923 [Thamnocephalis sphaerospora]|eukprot:RKP08267.1 hypothetical protein THASP1DRAFT_29923 [Thamnocephalis sphaerospora]